MEIYLIRHTSVEIAAGVCYGRSDVDVKSSFFEEASNVKSQIQGIVFDHVYTSPLTRARKLASFCGFPDAELDFRLTEFNFGDWELQSYERLYSDDLYFRSWINDYVHLRCPNGDNLMDQVSRVRSFLTSVKQDGYQKICAFCHGGVLAIGRSICNGISLTDSFKNVPPYGSVLHLHF
jgi:alpha-ribazole phosphatase